jgi:hypothetical protein
MAAAITAVVTAPTLAAAQAEDQAAARALFEEGRSLVRAGKTSEGCRKFEAASKLYAGSGVLLNLGDCYERMHRTASAWTEFGEAAAAAVRMARPADDAEARRRQAALEPKLSRLAIHVAKETPGLVIGRDGRAVDPAAWEAAIPVDPGTHVVRAEAPGRTAWSAQVDVPEAAGTVTVSVPALVPVASEAALGPDHGTMAASPVTAPAVVTRGGEQGAGGTQRIVGWTLLGAGVVGAGVGGVLGLVAKGKYDAATHSDGADRVSQSRSAVATGNVATGVVIGGAVVAAAGLVVWLTAPRGTISIGTNGTELLVRGSF